MANLDDGEIRPVEVQITITMPEAMDFDRAAAIVREQAEKQIREFFRQRHTDAERIAALERVRLAVAEGQHIAEGEYGNTGDDFWQGAIDAYERVGRAIAGGAS